MDTYRTIEVEPLTVRIGAVVSGVDLREPMSDEVEAEMKEAIARHCVLFFRGQDLTGPQQLAFASRFGQVNRSDFRPADAVGDDAQLEWLEDSADSPPATDVWHTDRSHWPAPPEYAVLNCREVPPVGGDTLWLSLYALYESLSPVMQDIIQGLMLDVRPSKQTMGELTPGLKRVVYSTEGSPGDAPGHPQPLVRVHPVTGRKALFMCGYSMYGIIGMKPDEGMALIELFRKGLHDPGIQCRWHWEQHDLVIWDERCTNHRAISDHFPEYRLMRRCTAGAAPAISAQRTLQGAATT
jgi:taurine dioxygenase